MVNAILSLLFACYLLEFRPFINVTLHRINVWNEVCYYVASMIYLTFTDFNPNAENKVFMGWLFILLVLFNLTYPNGFYMLKGMWPGIKEALTCGCCKDKKQLKRRMWVRQLDNKRRNFIEKHGIELLPAF